jgi:hypothetical protein
LGAAEAYLLSGIPPAKTRQDRPAFVYGRPVISPLTSNGRPSAGAASFAHEDGIGRAGGGPKEGEPTKGLTALEVAAGGGLVCTRAGASTRACPYHLSDPCILMMESAEKRDGHD